MKKVLKSAKVFTSILWRKYILRKKPAEAVTSRGTTVTQEYLNCYDHIRKLIESDLIYIDFSEPRVYVSFRAYLAFLRPDESTDFADNGSATDMAQARLDSILFRMGGKSDRALAFLDKIRFYINFSMAYNEGATKRLLNEDYNDTANAYDNDTPSHDNEDDDWQPKVASKWINISITTRDEKDILLTGRWCDDRLELLVFDKHN